MGDRVNIKKGNIKNCVSKGAFEQLYKPNGWVIDNEVTDGGGINEELQAKGITNEEQALTYIKEKKNKSKLKFNDNLFKGE